MKLNVILSTPLELAVDFLGKAMRHMESQNAGDTIKELEKVKDHSMQAFHYAKGQGVTTQNLKNAVLAKQLSVFSEILTKSYDGTKIIPFSLLDEQKKRNISLLVEDEISSLQKFHDSYSGSVFTLKKAEKAKKRQDILDGLLRTSYPFISEGRGFTNALGPVKLSIKLLLHLLPECILIYLVLTLYLHQLDSHQARLNKVSDSDTPGPIVHMGTIKQSNVLPL